jgi:hypothetical protein
MHMPKGMHDKQSILINIISIANMSYFFIYNTYRIDEPKNTEIYENLGVSSKYFHACMKRKFGEGTCISQDKLMYWIGKEHNLGRATNLGVQVPVFDIYKLRDSYLLNFYGHSSYVSYL